MAVSAERNRFHGTKLQSAFRRLVKQGILETFVYFGGTYTTFPKKRDWLNNRYVEADNRSPSLIVVGVRRQLSQMTIFTLRESYLYMQRWHSHREDNPYLGKPALMSLRQAWSGRGAPAIP